MTALIVKEKKPLLDTIIGLIIPESAQVILGYDVWDIDKRWILIICFVFYCVFLGCGLAIGVTQYKTTVEQKFISLDPGSGVCTEVPRSLNSVYEVNIIIQLIVNTANIYNILS